MFKVMLFLRYKLVCLLVFQSCLWTYGQMQDGQYAFVVQASQYAKDLYSEANKSRVYQGMKYVPIAPNRLVDIGSPYCLRSELGEETITIGGTPFVGIPILFDLMQNKVVSAMPGTTLMFSLVNEDIDQFTLEGHTFINLRDSSIRQLGFEPGFYDLLFDGSRLKTFAKRTKKYSEASNTIRYGATIQKIYTDKTDLFVWMEGQFFLIKSKKALLSLLKSKQPQMHTYVMNESKRLSKGDLEEILVTVSKLYDTL
jgi:hypothetical protein